jgi:hypothetical protein
MLRLQIQLVRHCRVTSLLFRSPGETDGYALLIAFNAPIWIDSGLGELYQLTPER